MQYRSLRAALPEPLKTKSPSVTQLRNLLVTVPDGLRSSCVGSPRRRWWPRRYAFSPAIVRATRKRRRGSRSDRWLAVTDHSEEIAELDIQLARLVAGVAPGLVALPGVGTDYAATLLVAAGDDPKRLKSEASFASLPDTAMLRGLASTAGLKPYHWEKQTAVTVETDGTAARVVDNDARRL